MKIAVASEDGKTISKHFGRAPFYIVVTVDEGKITGYERRDKVACNHQAHQPHSHTEPANNLHGQMAGMIADCEAVLTRGMGTGAYQSIQQAGIKPVITDIATIDEAVIAYAEGQIVNHTEKLH